MKALAVILLLLYQLLPVAGLAHVVADAAHAGSLTSVIPADADDYEDTHHTQHAPLIFSSESPIPSDPFHLIPARYAGTALLPLNHSLYHPSIIFPIFHPPQNLC